jgi:hypothetical protein
MIFDGGWQFSGTAGIPGSTDSPTSGSTFSANTVDLGPGARDLGIGDGPALKLTCVVTTAFAGGTSLQISLLGSTDNSNFTPMVAGPAIAEANLVPGCHVFDLDLARVAGSLMERPGASQALPRYLKLGYTSVGTHSSGAIFCGAVLDRADQNYNYPSSHSTLFPAGV